MVDISFCGSVVSISGIPVCWVYSYLRTASAGIETVVKHKCLSVCVCFTLKLFLQSLFGISLDNTVVRRLSEFEGRFMITANSSASALSRLYGSHPETWGRMISFRRYISKKIRRKHKRTCVHCGKRISEALCGGWLAGGEPLMSTPPQTTVKSFYDISIHR